MRKRQASKSAQTVFRTPVRKTGRQVGTQVPICPAEAGRKSARCHRRTGLARPSGRTGLRLGSCEPAGPRIPIHGLPQAEPRLRPRIPPPTGPRLRLSESQGAGTGTQVPDLPSGEPPGPRPCAGSPRGTPKERKLRTDPGGIGAGTPGSGLIVPRSFPELTPGRKARRRRRDSGGWRRRQPPLLFPGQARPPPFRFPFALPPPAFAGTAASPPRWPDRGRGERR